MTWKLLLPLLIASPAWALHRPTSKEDFAELRNIQDLLHAKKNELDKIRQLQNKLDKLVNHSIDRKPQAISLIQKELHSQIALHQKLGDEIVRRTIKLYDIHPSKTSAWAVIGPAAGPDKIVWKPVYAPEQKSRKITSVSLIPVILRAPAPGYAGVTWADGVVQLTDAAFEYSPGYLAAVAFHESVHFEQLTTPGRGDKISAFEAEFEAHSAMRGKAAIFDLTEQEKGIVNNAFLKMIHEFEKAPGTNMASWQFAGDAEQSQLESEKITADDGFLSSAKQDNVLAQAIRHDIIETEQRNQTEQAPEKERAPWEAINKWADVACAYMNPDGIEETDSVHLHWLMDNAAWEEINHDPEKQKDYLRSHWVVMPRQGIDSWLHKESSYSDPCQRKMILMARNANDPINVEWVIREIEYRRNGGAVGAIGRGISNASSKGGRLAWSGVKTGTIIAVGIPLFIADNLVKALGSAAGALVHGISAPFISSGSSSHSRDSGRSNSHERESQHSPDNWSSLQELRGYAGQR